ncbi:MAG: c-type cytochrome [Chthoniobacter sp.]|nr:c-type cytochrome [Chthoniobacter sp.]
MTRPLVLAAVSAALTAALFAGPPGGDLAQQQPKFKWDVPPAPVVSGDDALKSFKLPPGFRIELVASEPLVQNPVAMVFDPDGRLYVVEMRGYMPDADGKGEDEPTGDVALLEDTDGDGKFDKRTVFLDGLVMPRSIALAHGGVIVGEPPNLWFCRDKDGDGRSDEKTAIFTDYGARGTPEYNPNSTLRALDNWFYGAHFAWRFRLVGEKWMREAVPQRGQYGLAQDDLGRLFFNGNSSMLHAEVVAPEYTRRSAALASASGGAIARGEVFPGRVTAGINRAYTSVGASGKMTAVTAACGPHIYRGDRFPAEFRGNAFVCEPSGNLISRQVLAAKGAGLTATSAHTDVDFLVSTDERFRPVNLATGPDGALYIADFHHGILQHKNFLSAYLRDQVAQRGLAQPLHLGRIFRIVHESAAPGPRPALDKAPPAELVKALAHPNGWWRDTAQRLLVERADATTVPALKQLATARDGGLGTLHALWTLRGMDALDAATISAASASTHAGVRAAAVRLAEPLLRPALDEKLLAALLKLHSESDPGVQMQMLFTLMPIPDPRATQTALEIFRARGSDPLLREAAVSGLAGRELPLLETVLADKSWANPDSLQREFVAALARSLVAGRSGGHAEKLLAVITAPTTPAGVQAALLGGLGDAPKSGKGTNRRAVKLDREPAGLIALAAQNKSAANALAAFTWPGKPGASADVPPLTADEQKRFAEGRETYATICAACHQPTGLGLDGVAPPLLDSEWVLGSEERLTRLVLRGMTGKVTVNKRTFELEMPPLEALTDAQLAGVFTYIRREWGHESAAVEPATVARIRTATKDRVKPWTVDELLKVK